MSQNGALNANQKKAIAALLSTSSVKAAAAKAGLSRRTFTRYLSNPDFRAELRKRQADVLAATVSALAGKSGEALETLFEVMKDGTATHADRRQAAVSWLEYARRFVETDQILERLEALENEIETRN